MMAQDDRGIPPIELRNWPRRLSEGRFILSVAAIMLLALALAGALSFPLAMLAFAVLVAAALVPRAHLGPAGDVPSSSRPAGSAPGDPLLEAVLAGIPDPVIALDGDGNVVALNASASRVAPGLRRGEPASLTLRVPEVVDAIRYARSSAGIQKVEFYERVPIDRWFEAVVAPVYRGERRPGARPDLILMTFRDLTPLRRVEEMRADFVANASHELRTPLAALSGFIDTLQGPARNDAAARERFLAIMQAQATRMARLIDDLLSLSRIELSAHVRPETRVDLVPIVRQVADGLQTLARDRDVRVNVHAPAVPLTVLGDRDELIRVFENLVENALKYASAGKRVDIVLTEERTPDGVAEARVAVRDYGPGIPPEHLPRLTERFYRVDIGESRAQGGTGLGLALVKHILNRHHGRLTIESPPGQGATFTTYLPLPTGRDGRN
jgi:two-component system phosphate regulon sensor histidine kinase PhoR